MDSIDQNKPAVSGHVTFSLSSKFTTLRVSCFFLALVFAGILSGGYYLTSSYKFNTAIVESKKTILDIVTAFVSTYSQQRTANSSLHLLVPASLRALSLELFDEEKSVNFGVGMQIKMVGLQGLAIKTEPVDEQVATTLGQMAQTPSPLVWSGYIGGVGEEVLRTIKPVIADRQACLDCHNGLQKKVASWALGDVMGAYVFDVPASSFFTRLRWESGALGVSAFLFIWASVAFFMQQQARMSTVKAQVLREREKGVILADARKLAENEAAKLSAQVCSANDDLKQALKKQQELNALQRQFISMASHEFRTPLAIIDGTAQRIERCSASSSSEEINKRAQKIRSAVGRMTRLMEGTLTAASLDVGKLSLNIEPCDFTTLLNDVCQHQMELVESHKITCEISELPVTIQADPCAVEQIITNLLSNAIKYSPGSSDIEVKAYSKHGDVVLEVRDYGLGIDAEDLPHMFERFFRARTSTGIAGTGIGLNLVKTLVELHGGSVAITSAVGEGSTFSVHLPQNGPKKI